MKKIDLAACLAVLLGACALSLVTQNLVADECVANLTRLSQKFTTNERIDNDTFGGLSQDQGYTNGFLVGMASPT